MSWKGTKVRGNENAEVGEAGREKHEPLRGNKVRKLRGDDVEDKLRQAWEGRFEEEVDLWIK